MSSLKILLLFGLLAMFASTAHADSELLLGGDIYARGSQTAAAPRDVFVSGFNAILSGKVEKDAHLAGFDVTVDAPVGQDLYAAGFSTTIIQPVGGDLSAAGFTIHVRDKATVSGNARLAGGTVTVDAPILGSFVASASSLKLNSNIVGDADLTIGSVQFGTAAMIGGKLTYRSTAPLIIPESVISHDRVRFEQITPSNAATTAEETARKTGLGFWPTFGGILFGLAVSFGFLALVGAILFAFAPNMSRAAQEDLIRAPLKCLILGVLALSATIGLVPVGAITLIGLPLIPVAILASVVLWIIGYLLGAFTLAAQIYKNYRPGPETTLGRVALLLLAIISLSLFNFIPVLGWLINLGVMFLGLGALALDLARRVTRNEPAAITSFGTMAAAVTVTEAPVSSAVSTRRRGKGRSKTGSR